MKRFGSLLLALSSLLFFAGCSGSGGTKDPADVAADLATDSFQDTTPPDQETDLAQDLEADARVADAADLLSDTATDLATDALGETGPDSTDLVEVDTSDTGPDSPDICVPDCEGKMCGDDGCGGDCGSCISPTGQVGACVDGNCVCVPDCTDKVCGGDGCGGKCGQCEEHFVCVNFACEFQPWCGDGNCDVDLSEECASCEIDCACDQGSTCIEGVCCTPACDGLQCGDDGCGGSCGECGCGEECSEGLCFSTACDGKTCGDDGCGGTCGSCGCGESCVDFGCTFTACATKVCGDDGCGGSCGSCTLPRSCQEGECVCPTGWDGPNCDICAPGYYGTECLQCPCWATSDVALSELAQSYAGATGQSTCTNTSHNTSMHDWNNRLEFHRTNCSPSTCDPMHFEVGSMAVTDPIAVPPTVVDTTFYCDSMDQYDGPLPWTHHIEGLTLGEAEACVAVLAQVASVSNCPWIDDAPFCPCWPTPTTMSEDLALFEADTGDSTCYNTSSPVVGDLWTLNAQFFTPGCTPTYCTGLTFAVGSQIKWDSTTVPPTQVGTVLACNSVDSYNGPPPAKRSKSDLYANEALACIGLLRRLAKTENCPGQWTSPLDP